MITTTYKCDKCGGELPSNDELWEVGVVAKSTYNTDNYVPEMHIDVCRLCLGKLGIIQKKREKAVTEAPTLEALIVEIVQRHLDLQRY